MEEIPTRRIYTPVVYTLVEGVGFEVGEIVGWLVGFKDGARVGDAVGLKDGLNVGVDVGAEVGFNVGDVVGFDVGAARQKLSKILEIICKVRYLGTTLAYILINVRIVLTCSRSRCWGTGWTYKVHIFVQSACKVCVFKRKSVHDSRRK